MANHLIPCSKEYLLSLTSVRPGETKIGQTVPVLSSTLEAARAAGVTHAILGVPEDIGVRANLGRGGADGAWAAFLGTFLNLQDNQFLDGSKIAILGHVKVDDLMVQSKDASVEKLRALCADVDGRVTPIVEEVVNAGIKIILIGGGHNNAFPLITGTAAALRSQNKIKKGIAVANFDLHADFRPLEGRHSGNPFSYAAANEDLQRYFVLGLHEAYVSRDMLDNFQKAGCKSVSFEDLNTRKAITPEKAVTTCCHFLSENKLPVGIEVDLDSICDMPSSAKTPAAYDLREALYFVHTLASTFESPYLHLPEGAPARGGEDGARDVGRALSHLAVSFIKASKS